MRIKRHYFESGKFAGLVIFWRNYRYRTYVHLVTNWHNYPKDKPRWLTSKPWWHRGGLMLITSRIEWETILWVGSPESYAISRGEIADNLYASRHE
jgi:hypothetical protein